MRLLIGMLVVWLLSTGVAFAQSGFDDITGLPEGDEIAITEPAAEPEPVATVPAEETAPEADTGPVSLVVVVVGAMLVFYLVQKKQASSRTRL